MKAPKAADLRLGNYVWNDVQNIPVRVDMKIFSEQEVRERMVRNGKLKEDVLWKALPITAEILPKMGFQNEDGFRFSLRWATGGMQIMEIAGFWYPCIWNEPEMSHEEIKFVVLERIEHVHQLQNLLLVNKNGQTHRKF